MKYEATLTPYSYALNQKECAFLRLPGELRNRIYEHILGGLIFSSTTTPRLLWAVKGARIRHVECQHKSPGHSSPATLELSILETCRQIHEEARLLAFKLNTFAIDPTNLTHFINDLTDVQRDSIHTFKVGDSVASQADVGLAARRLSRNPLSLGQPFILPQSHFTAFMTPEDLLSEWSGLYKLVQLRGLKRLVIGNAHQGSIQGWTSVQRNRFLVRLDVYFRDMNVEVVFEEFKEA